MAERVRWIEFGKNVDVEPSKAPFPTSRFCVLVIGDVSDEEHIRTPWAKKVRVKSGDVMVLPVGFLDVNGGSKVQATDILDSIRKRNKKILVLAANVTQGDLDGDTDSDVMETARAIQKKIRAYPFTNEYGDEEVIAATHKLVVTKRGSGTEGDEYRLSLIHI